MGLSSSRQVQGAKPAQHGFVHAENSLPDYAAAENKGKHFIFRPEQDRPVQYCKTGEFSQARLPGDTVLNLFAKAVAKNGACAALKQERPTPELGTPCLPLEEWKTWTYAQYWADARNVAKSLVECGVERYAGVCIYGFNAPEWFISSIGTIMAGALVTGIYPTDSQDQVEFKVRHCRAKIAIVEDWTKVERLQTCTGLQHIVIYSPDFKYSNEEQQRTVGNGIKVWTWAEFLSMEHPNCSDADLDAIQASLKPQDCLALIYTSGTTGNAKGVMISHDNVLCECYSVILNIPGYGQTDQERTLSFLPLSHVAGFIIDNLLPLIVTGMCPSYSTTCFTRPYDMRAGTIGERIKGVRPTLFFGVPRIWEKFADKLREVEPKSGVKRTLFEWAKACGHEYFTNKQVGGSGMEPKWYWLAKRLVHDKIARAIGLDQSKLLFSGAAPLQYSTQVYLASLGMNVMEVYGMSESCGAATANGKDFFAFGSCGGEAPIAEVKVLRKLEDGTGKYVECPPCKNWQHPTEEEQGELCYRGRTIMLGYMCGEGDDELEIIQKNCDAIDEDGWLHSGDKGCKDELGMFHVTGRFKEIIITAGGENVAPVPIEDAIKHLGKSVISNVQMVGDKRKYNVALITLATKGATGEKPGEGELDLLAAKLVPGVTTVAQACESPEFIKQIESWVRETNENGKVVVSNAAKIQKFTILPRDYSIETGELTATLKLKRSVAEQNHAKALDALYAEDVASTMFIKT